MTDWGTGDLPAGWAWAKLGEIADVQLGKMLDAKRQTGEHAMPYLRNINVQWHRTDLDDLLHMDIAPDERERYTVRTGDLLVCEGGEPGRCAMVPAAADGLAYQKALHRVRAGDGVLPGYLAYLFELMAQTGRLFPYFTGSTIRHLPREKMLALPVPIAPTEEQRGVVDALDTHITRLNHAREALTRVVGLVAAFERTAVQAIFKKLADRYESHPLTSVVTVAHGQTPSGLATGAIPEPASVPFFKVGDLNSATTALTQARHYVSTDEADRAKLKVRPTGTVVFPKRGGAIFTNKKRVLGVPGAYDLNTIGLIPTERVSSEFLLAFMLTVDLGKIADGSNVPQINNRQIEVLTLPVPPLGAQERVAGSVHEAVDGAKQAIAGLSELGSRVTALRRALLGSAFAGRMVAQDPAGEPAYLLLKRIAEERATATPSARHRRVRAVSSARTAAGAPHVEESA